MHGFSWSSPPCWLPFMGALCKQVYRFGEPTQAFCLHFVWVRFFAIVSQENVWDVSRNFDADRRSAWYSMGSKKRGGE